ncbi:MAG: enoyl-CoA hydratase/isomerase family protein [Phycisphaerales bacterium]|nr:enoyl-CoA hydratase/isomerase family protein [Phycisphaerales bacterium]
MDRPRALAPLTRGDPTIDSTAPVLVSVRDGIARVTLNDAGRRNAMTIAMFDALDDAFARVRDDASVRVVLLDGAGPAFCAGFDLTAAADDQALVGTFIRRLSTLCRTLRRVPAPVVVAVRGAAIAGGCAVVSACDLVVASAAARLGYPVHRIGLSPAVSLPTLDQAVGAGAARMLTMSGRLVTGAEAHALGLVTTLVEDDDAVGPAAEALATTLAAHGPHALRVTKAWLNEIDGSLDDARFDAPAADTAEAASTSAETAARLAAMWAQRARDS